MAEKEKKLGYNIKGKLISSIAMLLVAVIMVVSSTYAWFTLSTAPEVTSISTAVGANGALEIALNTGVAIQNGPLADGVEGTAAENTYWGNLINLSYAEYGASKIVLSPAQLNTLPGNNGTTLINSGDIVSTPDYNAGGRVTGLSTDAESFGTYNTSNNTFRESAGIGFRAIGVASGLTARQQSFRSALAGIATQRGIAQVAARSSLLTNGETLAAVAVRKALTPDATYTKAEVQSIISMINGLEDSIESIEKAYIQALIATALGSANPAADGEATTAAGVIIAILDDTTTQYAVGARLEAALTAAGETDDTKLQALPGYSTYKGALADLNLALAQVAALQTKITANQETYAWNEISSAIYYLLNTEDVVDEEDGTDAPDYITINGVDISKANTEEGKNTISSQALSGGGIHVRILSGGSIYSDIADLCGDYNVELTIDTTPFGLGVSTDVPAKMFAVSTNNNQYLTNLGVTLKSAEPSGGNAAENPFTEFYGYVIDLAFKTNAASSNLLLQYEAKDRIYADNNNEATMGGGSTMSFSTADTGFTVAKMASLMGKIRVVFFDTSTYTILANAKLDIGTDVVPNYTVSAEGEVTAYIKLVDENGEFITTQTDAAITSLDQNIQKNISVLVYLDGASMTNADVAATEESSLVGTVNIQFASSANLVPMEYGDLYTPDADTSN